MGEITGMEAFNRDGHGSAIHTGGATDGHGRAAEAVDITAAARELGDAIARYSEVHDLAESGNVAIDEAGRIIDANPSAAKLLGFPRANLLHGGLRYFVRKDERPLFDSLCSTAILRNTRQVIEMRMLRARRSPFHAILDINPVEGLDRKSARCAVTITDVTERKEAEKLLRAAQARLEHAAEEQQSAPPSCDHYADNVGGILGGLTDGVAIYDVGGQAIYMNNAFRELLRIPPDLPTSSWECQSTAKTIDGGVIPEDDRILPRTLRGEVIRDYPKRLSTAWGQELALTVSGAPIRDGNGRIVGAVHVIRDQSEAAAAGSELRERLEKVNHVAEVLQDALLPIPKNDFNGCMVAFGYKAALDEAKVGGDFYDVFELGEDKIAVLIGDVAGKGLRAAVRVSAARFTIRSYAYIDPRPGRTLSLANDALCRDRAAEHGNWLTAFFAIIDTKLGSIAYANGGHEAALLRSSSGLIEWLGAPGQVLGVESGYDYPEHCRRLHAGDTIVVVTDGITEARRDTRRFFGLEGVDDYLRLHPEAGPSEIVGGVLAEAIDFAGGHLRDDAAIVAVQLNAENSTPFLQLI